MKVGAVPNVLKLPFHSTTQLIQQTQQLVSYLVLIQDRMYHRYPPRYPPLLISTTLNLGKASHADALTLEVL